MENDRLRLQLLGMVAFRMVNSSAAKDFAWQWLPSPARRAKDESDPPVEPIRLPRAYELFQQCPIRQSSNLICAGL
jgi:hypothetical protein